ncbi:MAG: hypothetical protein R3A80_02305 [Bdellovibrionota bacterium]
MHATAIHPLKKAAIKPSSSTLRGMLSPKEFKIVDSTLQSLRAAGGIELSWEWKSKSVGWVCAAKYNDHTVCELHAANDPIKGVLPLPQALVARLQSCKSFPKGFKTFLNYPIETRKNLSLYELELETTELRDLLSSLVGAILEYVD